MAQSYTRQSTFADGDTITASLFNNEYNQLINTFAYSAVDVGATGHRHDGSSAQGGNIHTIGDLDFFNKIVVDSTNNRWGVFVQVGAGAVEQIRIQDGGIVPVTTNDIDLGTASLQFKDIFIFNFSVVLFYQISWHQQYLSKPIRLRLFDRSLLTPTAHN